VCPVDPTFCPDITTQCPAAQTTCPEVATSCPTRTTYCPVVATTCPATPVETVCPIGQGQTYCPWQATSCPMFDYDMDGKLDSCDNCTKKPNGPNYGTCTAGSKFGATCTTPGANPTECGTLGFCSMAQEDSYPPSGNGCGDACDCEGDFEPDGDVDGTDAFNFKKDFFRFNCSNTNRCNGDFDCDKDVDGTDAVNFKRDFFKPNCPTNCNPRGTANWCVYP